MLGNVLDAANLLVSLGELAASALTESREPACSYSLGRDFVRRDRLSARRHIAVPLSRCAVTASNEKPPAGHCRRFWRLVHEEV